MTQKSACPEGMDFLRNKAAALPSSPGVYIMHGASGEVIYVGKSRSLRDRVSQYFHGSHDIKTERMAASVADFRFIACDTEMEALALENSLIKQHKPKYNVKLKDAKSYPYVKITAEEYPRLVMTRRRLDDGGKYFGPYSSTSVAYSVIAMLERTLGIPSCSRKFPRDIGKERPCIYRQIGRCVGVCAGDISAEEYREVMKSAESILTGGLRAALGELEERMLYCAENLFFEEAARCRDSIDALKRVGERQKTVGAPDMECDVIAVASSGGRECAAVLYIRGGLITDSEYFTFGADEILQDCAVSAEPSEADGGNGSPADESERTDGTDGEKSGDTGLSESPITAFITGLYRRREYIPREIWVNFPLSEGDIALLDEYFRLRKTKATRLRRPIRGDARKLCMMAERDAVRHAELEARDEDKNWRMLAALASLLGLEALPERIEAYDISNLGAEHITAGMAVAIGGKLAKSEYRTFKIESLTAPDDYSAMREAILRRLTHIGDGDDPSGFSQVPDLILLDGGRGHVSVIKQAIADSGFEIPVFGMVKDEHHKTRTVCTEDGEIGIARENEVFRFVYGLQEEVHRYTVGRMTRAKRKTLKTSSLEKIPGIGPQKAKLLLRHFGTVGAIRAASRDEISGIPGITERDADRVHAYFEEKA